ncbi:unnamed protein product [Rhizoctonia solani]|uniref:Protein kinase domain-containing protein n=1 Tax=Rhizoctonia solani TaxID=456999 RepID=A0A8H3C535_9AGAM|nr:unnamed protein product [Rhizoctonia solani]
METTSPKDQKFPQIDDDGKLPEPQGFNLRALDNTAGSESYDESYKEVGSGFIKRLGTWGVESRGIYPVSPEQRTDPQFSNSFFVWLSCNLNILSFSEGTVGVLIYGLTFRQAAGVIVGFNLLSALPPAYLYVYSIDSNDLYVTPHTSSTFGPKLGLRQMVQARYSFGWFGAIVPGAFNLLVMMGYNILNAILAGQTLSVVSGGKMSWNISFFGYRILNWYERVAWFPVLVMYLVVLGIGGKHLTSVREEVPLAPARSVLSYGATVAAFIISYAALMSDYTNYMRVDVASYLGLLLPTASVQLVGAAFAASLPSNPSWQAGYEAAGAGGLVDAILAPSKGFGKFLTVLLALSVIANMGPTLYSFSISSQVVLPFSARVPRYVFSIAGTGILIPLAIVGSTRFEETLVDFLGLVGYWSSTFIAVITVEHVVFRKNDWSTYDISHWNAPRRLPPGIAALGALWFTGPIAKTTGDIGFEVGGRRQAIKLLVVANPDGSSDDEDTPADTYFNGNGYTTAPSRPATVRASSPPRKSATSPRTVTSPSPTSYEDTPATSFTSGSSNHSSPEPHPHTPSQQLPPVELGYTKPSKPHVTPNLPVGEDSDNAAESSQSVHRPFSPNRQASPPQRLGTERIIVAVTSDAENYVVVDLTGHTDAQAIRERILSKLHIPDDVHPSFAIYRTELGGFAIGAALDDNQLLIDCQHFGDDKGTLKFLAQRADAPSESPDADVPVPLPPPTIAPVPPMLPSLSSFSPGAMRMPSSRRPGSASPASDRLASNGYEASVSGVSEFDTGEQDMARSPIQTLHRHPASRRGRQSTSWRVRRRGSGSEVSPIVPQAGSSPEHLSNTLSVNRAQERRGSVTPTPTATRSPPGFDDGPSPHMNTPAIPPTHSRRPSEPDSAYEREMALAAEERRREEENERWMAKQRAELASKRQQWARDHPNLVSNPTIAYQNGAGTSGYTSAGSSSGYMPRTSTGGAFPPNRTGSPMRTPSGHGRRPTDARPPSEQQYRTYQQQPPVPVRQQDPYSRQPQRARQPSPGGQPFVQQAPPPPPQPAAHPAHAQTYPYPQQQAYPSQQPQPYQQQPYPQQPQYVARNVPAGPPRGAMLPRTPGSEYIAQANPQWSYDSPDAMHRTNNGGTIGPMSGVGIAHQRAQSPQLRGGARSMGNLRESYGAPPPAPPPPPPAAQWTGGRGPSPGPVLTSPPGPQGQVLSPAAYEPPLHRQQSHDAYRPHQSSSPLQQSQTIQQQLPPPSMQQYHQQGAGRAVEQRPPGYGQYVEPQRTGGYMEPQRTGGGYNDQRSSGGYERSSATFEQPPPQRTSGFIEPQRTGGPFLEQQKTGGGYSQPPPPQQQQGYDRYERERIERDRKEYEARREYEAARERKEYEQQMQRPDPVPIQRPGPPSRQQTGTSPSHTSAMPRPITEPVSVPRAAEAIPRNASEFSTSPRPAAPMSNWNQSMLNRPNEPYYNTNGNSASLARRTFSGESLAQPPQQQRPQSAYDALPPSLRAGPRPTMQRPLTEYDRPSPSDLYRPPPLPQTPQHTTSPPVAGRYTHFASQPDGFAQQRPILDERVDDAYGGIEEPSPPLLLNTTLGAPPPYESTSPSSVAGEPSPIPPQTPEPDHLELSDNGTASPSASDASTVGYAGHARDTDSDRDSTTAVSESDSADMDADAGTLKADDSRVMAAIQRMVGAADGTATPPVPPPAPVRSVSQPIIPVTQPAYVSPPSKVISRDFAAAVQEEEEYDESDEDSGTLWQVPKQNSAPPVVSGTTGAPLVRRTATRPKGLRLRIDGSRPSSHPDSSPSSTQDSSTSGTFMPSTLPLEVRKKTAAGSGNGSGSGGEVPSRPHLQPHQSQSSSARGSSSWDIRPQAEEVYEKLDQFFPNHDLDKPVIDAPSGGTSPVTTEAPPMAGPVAPLIGGPGVRRHKKSIRVVAAERKKMLERINAAKIQQPPIDDSATYMPDSDSATLQPGTMIPVSNILRKRSTKMWGGRVEEVTPGSAALGAGASPNVPETIPEGGPGRQRPTFKWVKGQLIGRGSFGRVYHAMNLTTGEMIAVKQVELPKTDSDRADSRQVTVVDALKSESDTLRDLDHPHIVQYLGFEETVDVFSVFLEYVPGGSVGSVLRKIGKFEDEVVRSFSHQIIDGLSYLHKSGILHRDLKGDNILVDRSGICKISDFGISKRSEHVYNNHEGTAMQGSVFWMAPEMLHNNKQGYNAKIDIWSVGCVVLEMQAGRRPWTEDDMFAVMYKVGGLRQAPPVPDDVILSPLADDFRKKCFAIDPADRPTAVELLTHPWLYLPPGWVFKGFKER